MLSRLDYRNLLMVIELQVLGLVFELLKDFEVMYKGGLASREKRARLATVANSNNERKAGEFGASNFRS
jgi:hypothetical protein